MRRSSAAPLLDDVAAALMLQVVVDEQRRQGAVLDTILDLMRSRPRGSDADPRALTAADRATVGDMLPAIAGAYGDALFTAHDLCTDENPAVRLVVKGLSPKRLGKLLARAEGVPLAGLAIERGDKSINVWQWRIVAV